MGAVVAVLAESVDFSSAIFWYLAQRLLPVAADAVFPNLHVRPFLLAQHMFPFIFNRNIHFPKLLLEEFCKKLQLVKVQSYPTNFSKLIETQTKLLFTPTRLKMLLEKKKQQKYLLTNTYALQELFKTSHFDI